MLFRIKTTEDKLLHVQSDYFTVEELDEWIRGDPSNVCSVNDDTLKRKLRKSTRVREASTKDFNLICFGK